MFSCFQFCENGEFRPTLDAKPFTLDWKCNALPTELPGLEKMLFTLFLVVNLIVLPSFLYSFTFGALHDFFITLVYSEVVYFTVSSLWKRSSLPHKGLTPLAAGLKDQRSSDWSGGAQTEACLVVPCCWLERSPMFFGLLYVWRSSWFLLHHVSLLRIFMFS